MLILTAMASKIKTLVSKKKKRYQEGGFDLDLTYINDNVIAMGFPAEKLEGVYRNHIDDVVKFFDSKHKDHFMIYNLCAERDYDHSRFHERVRRFPFDDHNPPRLTDIKAFCEDVTEWLSLDKENVAAIHCKAGKGRTGVMITAYLLHSGRCHYAKDALEFYGKKRTYDQKGVTIPSQRRYVEYYGQLVTNGFKYQNTTLVLKSICFHPIPITSAVTSPKIVVYQYNDDVSEIFSSEVIELKKGEKKMYYQFKKPVSVTGDIKIEFSNVKMMKRDRIFTFWFNTFFIKKTSELDAETAESIASVNSASSSELCVNNGSTANDYKPMFANHVNNSKSSNFTTTKAISTLAEKSVFLGINGTARNLMNSNHVNNRASVCTEIPASTSSRLSQFAMPGERLHFSHTLNAASNDQELNASDDGEEYTLVLRKEELDKVNKDKAHKMFPADFKVIVKFKKLSHHSSNSTIPRPHSMMCHNDGIKLMGNIYPPNLEHGYRRNQETGIANSDNEYPETETETEETDEEWEGCQTDI